MVIIEIQLTSSAQERELSVARSYRLDQEKLEPHPLACSVALQQVILLVTPFLTSLLIGCGGQALKKESTTPLSLFPCFSAS